MPVSVIHVSFLNKSVLAERTGYMPRDDYKELTPLYLLILGASQIDSPFIDSGNQEHIIWLDGWLK